MNKIKPINIVILIVTLILSVGSLIVLSNDFSEFHIFSFICALIVGFVSMFSYNINTGRHASLTATFNDNLLTTIVDYGSKLGTTGLIDYYSGTNLRVTKTGHDAIDNAEWICMSGCTVSSKTFNQKDAYSASDFCDASNGDCEVVLGVNWDTSKLVIKYNTNGGQIKETTAAGTWSVANDALHLNNSLVTTTIHYGSKLGENGLNDYNNSEYMYITKTGRIAKKGAEWLCAYGDCEVGKTFNQNEVYSANDFCDASNGDCVVVLAVNWELNKVKINYSPNGGTVAPSTDAGTWKVVNNLIYKNDSLLTTTVNYANKLGENGLIDYYSGVNLQVSKTGYDAKAGAQWICLSGDCTKGKTFDYSTLYSASDFCDASNGDCEVVLGVNWQANKYTIKYNANGGAGTMNDSEYSYGDTNALSSNTFTRIGYKFAGWNTKADGSGTSYVDEQSVKNLSSTNGDTVNLFAQWTTNKYKVKYDANGGTGTMSDSSYTYGVAKALSANNFTKDNFKFKCWNTKADGTGVNYTDKQSISIAEDLTLYAQWSSNDSTGDEDDLAIKYFIKYNKNGGIGTMSNSEHKYGYASNLSKNKFTRIGYTFVGWNTRADGTGISYTDGQTISNLASSNGDTITLYAQWLESIKDDDTTTSGSGNNIDKSPQTGMLAAILVSLICIGSLGGLMYYHKKVNNNI